MTTRQEIIDTMNQAHESRKQVKKMIENLMEATTLTQEERNAINNTKYEFFDVLCRLEGIANSLISRYENNIPLL